MKISNFKLFRHTYRSTGFSLLELLVASMMMSIIASLISYGISSMIASNQNLTNEQNRRLEISRGMDLIVSDLKISEIKSVGTPPAGVSTPVLEMELVAGTCRDRIIYSIQPSKSGEIGPNVLYRYGRISGLDSTLDCTDLPRNVAIADGISINNSTANITEPTCNSPAVSAPTNPPSQVNGFYSCVSDNQASIAIFGKLSTTKTYGINRTITSGFIPDLPTTSTDCTVPDLQIGSATPLTQAGAEIAVNTTSNLIANGINLEPNSIVAANRPVLSQNPQPGTKIPCGTGLVTYTY